MNWRNLRDGVLGALGCLLFVGIAVLATVQGLSDLSDWWRYRDDPVYLISRSYDPISGWKDSANCLSPARIDRTPGRPNLDCMMFVKRYELVRLGLNPVEHLPYNREWEERALN